MQRAGRLTPGRKFLVSAPILLYWISVVPTAAGQGASLQGQDAVYNSSSTATNSPSFIDASMFKGNATDICGVLKFIFSTLYPANGAVIDARGLNSGNTNMTCSASPWAGIRNPPPSTILLPTGTIQIPSTWVLPSKTHLIGEGVEIPPPPNLNNVPGTNIQAMNNFSSPMIQFGSSSVCSSSGCSGISVEQLTLNGNGQSIDGIDNQYSQTNTYVDHVALYQILAAGLSVSNVPGGNFSATNSGPYTNITFDTGGSSGTSTTVCARLATSGTRGIHGLRCKSETNDAPAAVLLDGSNNSIEDVTIVGFFDGVLVGSNAAARSNVLVNVIGDTSEPPGDLTPVNAVHISNHNTVTDLSIMGVSNSGLSGTHTIEDDVTLPSASPWISGTSVAIYALGRADRGGYTRLTTSLSVPHWTVGTTAPPTSGGCTRGSLYSCTNGTSGVNCGNSVGTAALWLCAPSPSSLAWVPIK
jgi:hypothetical protein